ncbi:MAG: hypothetical protein BJ554DRAFT_5927, partial [Olpidium bornovanus]
GCSPPGAPERRGRKAVGAVASCADAGRPAPAQVLHRPPANSLPAAATLAPTVDPSLVENNGPADRREASWCGVAATPPPVGADRNARDQPAVCPPAVHGAGPTVEMPPLSPTQAPRAAARCGECGCHDFKESDSSRRVGAGCEGAAPSTSELESDGDNDEHVGDGRTPDIEVEEPAGGECDPSSPSPLTFSEASSVSTASASGTTPSFSSGPLNDLGISAPPLQLGPASLLYAAGVSNPGRFDCGGCSPTPASCEPLDVAVAPRAVAKKSKPAVSAVERPWQVARERRTSKDVRARQSRLLLAALLENFTSLYDQSRERSRRLFHLLCERLTRLGLLDHEHIDEMSSLRSTYIRAFRELISRTAWETSQPLRRSRTSPLVLGGHAAGPRRAPRLRPHDLHGGDAPACHSAAAVAGGIRSAVPLFDFTESRYASDFQEVGHLGKGGYGNVVAARNMLDSAVYAIKKINVGHFWDTDGADYKKVRPVPYAGLFREIKSLARLEHVNIVRYYSSWIEHAADSAVPVRRRPSSKHFPERFQHRRDSEPAKGDSSSIEGRRRACFRGRQRSWDESRTGQTSCFSSEDENVARLGVEEPLDSSFDASRKRKKRLSAASAEGTSSGGDARSSTSMPATMSLCEGEDAPVGDLVLFIQMQLYEANLRDWIRCRNRMVFRCLDRAKQAAAPPRSEKAASGHKCFCRALSPHQKSRAPARHAAKEPRADPLSHVGRFAAMEMFSGLASGVHHLHSRGHIHRDLKPANVLLERVDRTGSGSTPSSPAVAPSAIAKTGGGPRVDKESLLTQNRWIPKIGDFVRALESAFLPFLGLATTISRATRQERKKFPADVGRTAADSLAEGLTASSRADIERTKRVGTVTYASPEMLSGQEYDEKVSVDIWSLGIILFELLHPFRTDMERAMTLDGLRFRGAIPEAFRKRWPAETARRFIFFIG